MPVTINGTSGISFPDGSSGAPALRGQDADTGVFFPSADNIAFVEGGVEALRINSSGSIGLGTDTPTLNSKFEIYGTAANLQVHHAGNCRGGIAALSNQRLAIYTTAAADHIAFGRSTTDATAISGTNFTEHVRINNTTGNVGIGSTIPTAKLDIAGNTTSNIIGDINITRTGAVNTSVGQGSALQFNNATSNKLVLIQGSDDIFQVFNYGGVAWTERLRVDGSGRLTLPTQPSFRATLAGGVQIVQNAGTALVLTLTNVEHNVGSCYNSTNGRFTAPVNGYYSINLGMVVVNAAAASFLVAETVVNGSTNYTKLSASTSSAGSESGVNASSIIYLNANDYVQMQVYSAAAYTLGATESFTWKHGRTYFAMHLLS